MEPEQAGERGAGDFLENQYDGGPHEANFLKLDCSRLKARLGWEPVWDIDRALEKTADWFAAYRDQEDMIKCTDSQIDDFIQERNDRQ